MEISRRAYQELIDGDIEWLLRQSRNLERDHIEAVLRKSVKLLYGKKEQLMKIENIKFKAKRLDNGKWVVGYFYAECGNTYIIENRQKESKLNRNPAYQVDPSTVCQFTGLKDFYAEEVWEGDIIENPEFPFEKRTVTWFDCVLGFVPMNEDECQDRDVSFLVLFKKWKVVGNKFNRKECEK